MKRNIVSKAFHETALVPFATFIQRRPRPDQLVYRWERAPGGTDRVLVRSNHPQHARDEWDGYLPLEDEPALFRNFASLEANEEEFLRFAQKFGSLGATDVFPTLGDTVRLSPPMEGERFSRWALNHQRLRLAIEVADGIRTRRRSLLARRGREGTFAALLKRNWASPKISSAAEQGNWLPMARWWLVHRINEEFDGDGVRARVFGAESERIRIRIQPRTLVGAMWVQLAQAVDENREFRQCRNCRGWFLVSPSGRGRRRHAVYDTPACRLQHWRRSRAEAAGSGSRRRKGRAN